MKALNLMAHTAGSEVVDRQVIDMVKTPDANGIWRPIPHAKLIDGVLKTVERSGFKVVQEAHALARDGARYFGMMQLANGHNAEDYSLVLGLRNSHDKSFPAGLVVGSGVFVCDNLAFSGEIQIGRKHTTNINRDLPNLIEAAMGKLGDMRLHQDQRILAYKGREISDAQAHDILIQALDARVLPVTRIPGVVTEWRTPRHPEFAQGKTAWRLFNAFTEELKDSALFDRPRATQALHGLLDTVCSVN